MKNKNEFKIGRVMPVLSYTTDVDASQEQKRIIIESAKAQIMQDEDTLFEYGFIKALEAGIQTTNPDFSITRLPAIEQATTSAEKLLRFAEQLNGMRWGNWRKWSKARRVSVVTRLMEEADEEACKPARRT